MPNRPLNPYTQQQSLAARGLLTLLQCGLFLAGLLWAAAQMGP